jgi:hypothetical protein
MQQCVARQSESLFHGEFIFEDCMAEAIGDHDPGGIWGKLQTLFGQESRKTCIFRHCDMAALHEFIVGGSICTGKMTGLGQSPQRAGEKISTACGRQTNLLHEAMRKRPKRLGDDPNAVLRQVEIGEKTKDAVTLGGTRRKRVHVKKTATDTMARRAAQFFERPKASEIEPPTAAIGRQQAIKKSSGTA